MVGAFLGAVLAFLAYKNHFDQDADPARQARRLLDRPGDPLLRVELRHRGHRHVRAGLRDPRSSATRRTSWARSPSPSSSSASAPASVAPPATRSTRPVTSVRASRTPSCPSRARARATGRTPGSRSLGPLVGGALAGLAAAAHRLTPPPQPSPARTGAPRPPRAPARRHPEPPEESPTCPMANYVLAIDQGTTSTRAIVFDHSGHIVETGQIEHEQIFPKAGWVEHDAEEIWKQHPRGRRPGADPRQPHLHATSPPSASPTSARPPSSGTGPPASRSTTRSSGRTRARRRSPTSSARSAAGADRYKAKVGLPLATYFSGPKVKWILDNVEGAAGQGRGRRPGCSATPTRGCCGT